MEATYRWKHLFENLMLKLGPREQVVVRDENRDVIELRLVFHQRLYRIFRAGEGGRVLREN